jgi:hypothetical protein
MLVPWNTRSGYRGLDVSAVKYDNVYGYQHNWSCAAKIVSHEGGDIGTSLNTLYGCVCCIYAAGVPYTTSPELTCDYVQTRMQPLLFSRHLRWGGVVRVVL